MDKEPAGGNRVSYANPVYRMGEGKSSYIYLPTHQSTMVLVYDITDRSQAKVRS